MHTDSGLGFATRLVALRSRVGAIVLVGLAIIAAAAWAQARYASLYAAHVELKEERDSIVGIDLARALEENSGWTTAFGNTDPDSALAFVRARADSLVQMIEDRGLELVAYAEVVTELRTEIETVGVPVAPEDPTVVEVGVPTHWDGYVEQGAYTGALTFDRDPVTQAGTFGASLFAEVPLQWTAIDAGASMIFGVRYTGGDPGVSVQIEEFVYPKPEPPECRACERGHSWKRTVLEVLLYGGAGWLLNGGRDAVEVRYR